MSLCCDTLAYRLSVPSPWALALGPLPKPPIPLMSMLKGKKRLMGKWAGRAETSLDFLWCPSRLYFDLVGTRPDSFLELWSERSSPVTAHRTTSQESTNYLAFHILASN